MPTLPKPPEDNPVQLVITFFYYRDLTTAIRFYEDVMGFTLAIDQEWSKIYRIGGDAHIGLVDESRGMHRAVAEKPVQLCMRVADVDAWYAYAQATEIADLSRMFVNEALGIRAFTFSDPEGYQIEIQSTTRSNARGIQAPALSLTRPEAGFDNSPAQSKEAKR